MKKFLAALLIGALLPLSSTSPALAEEEMSWQYGNSDKATPKSFSKNRDLKQITFAIGPESSESETLVNRDRFLIFVDVATTASMTNLTDTSFVEIFIDRNLDKKSDFSIKFTARQDDTVAHATDMYKSDGTVAQDCQAYIWATATSYAASFNAGCVNATNGINISVRSTNDGSNFDFLPDSGAWQKFKTRYLDSLACGSGEKNKKVNYNSKTYICIKSGSKWAWKDYGPIAAKNAKWLTEKAFYSCSLNAKYGANLEDGGKTLTLDGAYLYFITEKDYLCVTKVLKMPASVERRVSITRALDGMQEASWGKISAFWNYHPDRGLNITFSYN